MWCLIPLLSLAGPASATELLVRRVTVADGLPHNWTSAVAQDDRGRLWFGSAGYVARYDGSRVRSWQVPTGDSFEFEQLVPLSDGTVIARQSYRDVWTLHPTRGMTRLTGTDGEALRAIDIREDGAGGLLVATDSGVWQHQRDRWEQLAASVERRPPLRVDRTHDGPLWVGTAAGWYVQRPGRPWSRCSTTGDPAGPWSTATAPPGCSTTFPFACTA